MKVVELLRESIRGKSIARILFNWEVERRCQNMRGLMIDLACGYQPSYYRYWRIDPNGLIRVDYNRENRPDVIADLNIPLPFKDEVADYVFLFNAIYIFKEPENTLREIYRILKNNGILYLSSPFVFNECPEPHDYYRFTSEKIIELLTEAGFGEIEITRLGERFSAAVHLVSPFIPKPLRFPFYFIAIFLDKIILWKNLSLAPCPVGYFCKAKKLTKKSKCNRP